jgi:hypothetical protein
VEFNIQIQAHIKDEFESNHCLELIFYISLLKRNNTIIIKNPESLNIMKFVHI